MSAVDVQSPVLSQLQASNTLYFESRSMSIVTENIVRGMAARRSTVVDAMRTCHISDYSPSGLLTEETEESMKRSILLVFDNQSLMARLRKADDPLSLHVASRSHDSNSNVQDFDMTLGLYRDFYSVFDLGDCEHVIRVSPVLPVDFKETVTVSARRCKPVARVLRALSLQKSLVQLYSKEAASGCRAVQTKWRPRAAILARSLNENFPMGICGSRIHSGAALTELLADLHSIIRPLLPAKPISDADSTDGPDPTSDRTGEPAFRMRAFMTPIKRQRSQNADGTDERLSPHELPSLYSSTGLRLRAGSLNAIGSCPGIKPPCGISNVLSMDENERDAFLENFSYARISFHDVKVALEKLQMFGKTFRRINEAFPRRSFRAFYVFFKHYLRLKEIVALASLRHNSIDGVTKSNPSSRSSPLASCVSLGTSDELRQEYNGANSLGITNSLGTANSLGTSLVMEALQKVQECLFPHSQYINLRKLLHMSQLGTEECLSGPELNPAGTRSAAQTSRFALIEKRDRLCDLLAYAAAKGVYSDAGAPRAPPIFGHSSPAQARENQALDLVI